jgi:hypothetical protein
MKLGSGGKSNNHKHNNVAIQNALSALLCGLLAASAIAADTVTLNSSFPMSSTLESVITASTAQEKSEESLSAASDDDFVPWNVYATVLFFGFVISPCCALLLLYCQDLFDMHQNA